jgi:5-methylcytosine-specific restriction endonuclease McrA
MEVKLIITEIHTRDSGLRAIEEARRERQRQSIREWKARNLEKVKEQGRRYYAKNKEKILAAGRRAYWEIRGDSERWASVLQRKRKNAPKYEQSRYTKRRLQYIAGDVTCKQLRSLFESSGGKCAYCGSDVNARFRRHDPRGFDHVTPLSAGGLHTISNMVVCCRNCNTRKGIKPTPEIAAH